MARINTTLGALKPQIVPIPLVEKTFEVDVKSLLPVATPTSKITVTRRALPCVPAYSMTTHKAQGQKMSKVVVDLRLPPGPEEIASRYVPSGRVKSRHDIAILRDFPLSALQVKPSKGQRAGLDRLDKLNELTIERYRTSEQ